MKRGAKKKTAAFKYKKEESNINTSSAAKWSCFNTHYQFPHWERARVDSYKMLYVNKYNIVGMNKL